MLAAPELHDFVHKAAVFLATRGDVGPFTDVDVETVALLGALGAGSVVAALAMLFITSV